MDLFPQDEEGLALISDRTIFVEGWLVLGNSADPLQLEPYFDALCEHIPYASIHPRPLRIAIDLTSCYVQLNATGAFKANGDDFSLIQRGIYTVGNWLQTFAVSASLTTWMPVRPLASLSICQMRVTRVILRYSHTANLSTSHLRKQLSDRGLRNPSGRPSVYAIEPGYLLVVAPTRPTAAVLTIIVTPTKDLKRKQIETVPSESLLLGFRVPQVIAHFSATILPLLQKCVADDQRCSTFKESSKSLLRVMHEEQRKRKAEVPPTRWRRTRD